MKFNVVIIIIILLMIFIVSDISGCTHTKFEDTALDVPQIAVSSDSIDETGNLLTETAADKKPNNPLGSNQSPQLTWEAIDGAACYVVCMFDEDANWLHWIVLDLEITELEQGVYTLHSDYIGPYPPRNSGLHNYRIEVFALKQETDNVILKLDTKQSYSDIVSYLNRSGNSENNIIARGYTMGNYEN
jgi:phosphatidylethanolamine-binding protein (PEBP) family uncharacterized protein